MSIQKLAQYIIFVMRGFSRRRLRSWLTILGIFIGIAAVVALISLGNGVKVSIERQFEMLGTDKLLISPGEEFTGIGVALTDNDLRAVKKTRGVELAGGTVFKISSLEYKDQVGYTFVSGIPLDDSRRIIEEMQSLNVKYGRFLMPGDSYDAIIGFSLSQENEFFKKPIRLGNSIKINGVNFRVVGILNSIGNRQDDASIIIPLEQARDIFEATDQLNFIIAKVQEGENPEIVAEEVKKNLRKSRNVREEEEDFNVQTTAQIMASLTTILDILQVVLVGIAAISLLVGGIGIMNTMYTSVLERTRDIGIMKAVGAKNSDILTIFLLESGAIGLVGGLIGIFFGILMSKTIERFASVAFKTNLLVPSFSPLLFIGVLIFSFLLGMASGLIPSIQASKMNVIDCIRYKL